MMFLTMGNKLLSIVVKSSSQYARQTQVSCVSRIQEFSSENLCPTNNKLAIESVYTPEEQTLILDKINSSTSDELKRYSITEARLRKVTAHKDKNGIFKSLEEIFFLQGIEIKPLDKFFKSIIKGEAEPKMRNVNTKGNFLTPPLNEDVRKEIYTSTGIWVSGSVISWAQMDSASNLMNWNCKTLDDANMKAGIVMVIESVANVVSNIPVSHAYIMESDPIIPFARMNSVNYYLHMQRQQVITAIAAILGTREKRFGDSCETETRINNIYMMRSRTPARLFDLLIGAEMVSAFNVADKMLSDDVDKNDGNIQIYAEPSIKEHYKLRPIYEQEQMNWALLLTAAFVNVSLLQRTSLQKKRKRQT